MKDAFERRTAGIFENGTEFRAEFRSIKNYRIGGTYTFDLMLEVPSVVSDKQKRHVYESEPVVETVIADVYMVGVVRHVYVRGMTGLRTRVPEPENDKVYNQVVTNTLSDVTLWKWNRLPWIDRASIVSDEHVVKVYTNRDDARFVVRNMQTKEVLASGNGTYASLSIPAPDEQDIQAQVEYLSLVAIQEDGKIVTLVASPGEPFTIKHDTPGSHSELANYYPQK